MLDLAVVIVTWNNQDIIANTLQSLLDDLATSDLRADVWLVDSASTDKTLELVRAKFPAVNVIASEDNLGFARSNNLGMRQIGFDGQTPIENLPRAVYLLNPDTVTKSGATQTLFNALMADKSAGLVGAQLAYADGSFQHGAYMFPGLRQIWTEFFSTPGRWIEGTFNGRYPREMYRQSQPFAVDFTLGATMMLKRDVLLETGLFDENFFMYCEEVDWAWRIHNAGWEVLCVPQAHVIHLGGQSSSQVRARSVINLWTSRLQLYDKHYPRWKNWLARKMVAQGMKSKMRALESQSSDDVAVMNAYQTVYEMAMS